MDRSSVGRIAQALSAEQDAGSGTEIVFVADASVYDGRFTNNGWLQELPDPTTKITWDNAVIVGVDAAERMGVDIGDMVRVTANGRSVEAVVMKMPGQHSDSVTVALGYGRENVGRIGRGAGFNFYPLRTSAAMGFTTGTVEKIAGDYPLATTQDHHAIDVDTVGGRGIQDRLPSIVREADVRHYEKHPDFAKHRTHVTHRLSLWDENKPFHDSTDSGDPTKASYAWGMTVDMNSCTGCNACVIACQAENNIPIVGKDQVLRGREMHWMRIDRYFKFGKTDGRFAPDKLEGVAMQPMACVHCENAPCEQVCPVAATVHDQDGLNVMVYNRCIGTRYCSNNCPYKVRRFNYFDFHRRKPARTQPGMLLQVEPEYYTEGQASGEPLQWLQRNPEVTVRMRGIMEKCTYCIQRIQQAKIDAKNEWVNLAADDPKRTNKRVPIEDGAVKTACQQSCPAEAIVFGDLKDPNSRVSQMQKNNRAYELLEELNVKPRTKYLARLRNPAEYVPEPEGHGHGHDDHGDHNHDEDHG